MPRNTQTNHGNVIALPATPQPAAQDPNADTWRDQFVQPIANFMYARGIREIRLEIENGKCRYWLDPIQDD